jgi:glycosyltransferase involved in cell wall biosynthesis
MRVVHVATSISDPSAGTTYAVTRLCRSLAQRGLQVELHAPNPLPMSIDPSYRSVGYPAWRIPAKLGVSPALRSELQKSAASADILHNHGMWQMPTAYAGSIARRTGRSFVFSVHGMLAPWALQRSRWKKTIVYNLGQRASLAAASCIHATAPSEYLDIRRLGLKQPVCVVPYGIDVPDLSRPVTAARRTVLFLGRVHPIKRVDVLVRAWAEVERAFPDWDLAICGPDNDGYLPQLQQLAATLGTARVRFLGPRYGDDKNNVLASSHLFVLPSFTENFGFAVAEALSAGVPAIVSKGAPWQGLEAHGCGWWTDVSVQLLATRLNEALAMEPGALEAMGRKGREWMIREQSWERVAAMIESTYSWLLGQADPPDWVRFD